MTTRHWQHFPHGADFGIRGFGDTPANAFEQAAMAMVSAAVDIETLSSDVEVAIEVGAPDLEALLIAWLNAVVREMRERHVLLGRFEVEIDGTRLTGRAWGERIDKGTHHPAVALKGATDSHLRVHQRPNGDWAAECVIDI
jgi:SHS2 domain-containing protein